MNILLKVCLCCVVWLACSPLAKAQSAAAAVVSDPCGDAAKESSFWGSIDGKVIRVEDGDTFTISVKGRGVGRVHLIGIDAPELGQPFGAAAHRLLERLVSGKTVEVWVPVSLSMGRLPAVTTGVVHLRSLGMLDANLLMIQAGLARYKESEPYSMSNHTECHYGKAEEDARNARRGLWQPPD
jgi:endonuclease YncB( thermonuclease family)